ncbi:type II secretion system F family protein [Streptacidiphilus sp. PAMC 29251]
MLERHIDDLVGRLQARWVPADALRAFADQLNDSTADKVLAALLLRAADRGPGLAGALADLADAVREEVRQRRAIEADRAKHRATVRWLVVIILCVVVIGSFDTSYVAPYNSLLGLAVLVAVGMAFVAVVAWMRSLASHTPTPRFLERDRRSRTGSAPDPVHEPDLLDPAPEFDTMKGGPRR